MISSLASYISIRSIQTLNYKFDSHAKIITGTQSAIVFFQAIISVLYKQAYRPYISNIWSIVLRW